MATTLLMLRVAWLAGAQRDARVPMHPAWPLLVLAGVALPWWLPWWYGATTTGAALPDLVTLRDALWPPRLSIAPVAPRVAALIRHVEAARVRLPAAGVVLPTLVALLWWTLV